MSLRNSTHLGAFILFFVLLARMVPPPFELTAQIIALYAAFLTLAVSAGAPALLSALVLAFFSNLYACLTHYGDGAAPIFFGSGYIELKDWWRIRFLLSVLHLVVWLGVGLIWWKLIGIY